MKRWYHFWSPDSGVVGGLIMGSMMAAAVIVAIIALGNL
jgi:hypothetical protein